MLLLRERSRSRSKVAVPASAYSSSKETSPVSSDWGVRNEDSSISVACRPSSARSSSSRFRSSASSFFVNGDFLVGIAARTVARTSLPGNAPG
jgi:hypothetical protein